jgi:Neuraminidase-like domain
LAASIHNVKALLNVQRMVELCTKLEIADAQIDSVVGWVNSIGEADAAFGLAAVIRRTLELRQKKSSASKAFATAQTGINQLKERRRTALINYILRDQDLKDLHITSADDLYDYFLVDVKMDAETLTSRIREGISTVQLFVQRCFLGIEEKYGVSPSKVQALKPRWDSIGRYTLWEGQRRAFLFPENWIDPTLRDTKTEPFKALEAAILQGDLTEDFISNAIRSYVYAIQSIAHLDVQSYLWDRGENDNARFHFFARTRTKPRQYFYRRLDLELFGRANRLSYWHPWAAIDIGTTPQAVDRDGAIQSQPEQYLIPALIRGRLLLFAPEITLKTKATGLGSDKSIKDQWGSKMSDLHPTASFWEIKMAWIELRNDKWSPRIVSPNVLTVEATETEPLPASSSFRFRVRPISTGHKQGRQG